MIELVYTIFLSVAFGCFAAFTIMTAAKFGWLDWYDMHRKLWMPERCVYCLGFWLCCILFGLFFKFSGEGFKWIYLFSIPIGTVINVNTIKGAL